MGKHFVSNKDESARIFSSDFLEVFTKVHWSVPLIIYIPVIIFLIVRSFLDGTAPIAILGILVAGTFFWTFIEYVLHRFIFHYEPKSEWGKRIHWTFHGVHHDYPQDSKRLVMPPIVSLTLGTVFYLIFNFILGRAIALPFMAGFILGYLAYDTIHYAIHHFGFKSKFWMKIKRHHMKHHYTEPDAGFGVSSPIWDKIFKTEFPEKNK